MNRIILWALIAIGFLPGTRADTLSQRPNFVVIMVDEMGSSDIGCFGGEVRTPNLDELARNGLRFTQFYNTAKCHTTPAFDRYYGLADGCCNFFNPGITAREGEGPPGRKSKNRVRRWAIEGYINPDKRFYTTDAFADYALKRLEEYQDEDKPFLLYLPYTAPHYPLHAWPEDIAKLLRQIQNRLGRDPQTTLCPHKGDGHYRRQPPTHPHDPRPNRSQDHRPSPRHGLSRTPSIISRLFKASPLLGQPHDAASDRPETGDSKSNRRGMKGGSTTRQALRPC